jgi:hypothetical protein
MHPENCQQDSEPSEPGPGTEVVKSVGTELVAEVVGHHLGIPGGGFPLTAPFEAESDRNLPAEQHEREEREARETFDKNLAQDEAEAAEDLARRRAEEEDERLATIPH